MRPSLPVRLICHGWDAATTSPCDRKRLLRTLVADVTLLPEPEPDAETLGVGCAGIRGRPTNSLSSGAGRAARHRKRWRPDHRLTCFFVDRNYRRQGMACVSLDGALHLIALAGGGVVESYPQKTPAFFLYNATRNLFEQVGLTYIRSKGRNHSVMRETVPATRRPAPGSGRRDERYG